MRAGMVSPEKSRSRGMEVVRAVALGVVVGGALGVLAWLATSLFWLFLFFAGAGLLLGLLVGFLLQRPTE